MTWTPFTPYQTLTADLLNEAMSYAVPISAGKGSDTARFSDATATADPDLVIVLPANRIYEGPVVCHVTSEINAGGDFRIGFGWTNTATVYVAGWGLNAAGLASGSIADLEAVAQASTTSPTTGFAYGASTTRNSVFKWLRVETGSSDVTFSVLWGQQVSNINDTILHAGSSIAMRRMNN